MAEKKVYELCLRWAGSKDTAMYRAAVKHAEVVTMFEASEPRIVTHDELKELIEAGKVRPTESYWGIREGDIGVVTISNIGSPTQWENASNCKGDFIDGWNAAMKEMK